MKKFKEEVIELKARVDENAKVADEFKTSAGKLITSVESSMDKIKKSQEALDAATEK